MKEAVVFPQKTLDDLHWWRITKHLASLCTTPSAAEAALRLPFSSDGEEVRYQLSLVVEVVDLIESGEGPDLTGVREIEPHLRRAGKEGLLDVPDLLDIASTIEAARRLKRFFAGRAERAPLMAEGMEGLHDLAHLLTRLKWSFDDNGAIADQASPDLARLRKEALGCHEDIQTRIKRVLIDPDRSPILQDTYYTIRDDRFVLPVKAESRSKMPGIVHGTSQTGATLFIEPSDLVELNNSLKMARIEVAREERRILRALTEMVLEHADKLGEDVRLLRRLDLVLAKARQSLILGALAPELSGDRIELKGARHPLLVLGDTDVVPNDIVLEGLGRALVITGPNAGGKTIVMKTVGLCVLMAMAGLPIPAAAGSVVMLVPQLFTDVGDEQDLDRHLSTFSGHLVNILGFLPHVAQRPSLVLLDELIVGTDPQEGAALAQAMMEHLVDLGAMVMATTHYERLKLMAYQDQRFSNGSMGFDESRMATNYVLSMGAPGASSALKMAARLGLPESVLRRAGSLLGDRDPEVSSILRHLQEEHQALQVEKQRVEAEGRAMARAKAELERREEEIRRRERDGLSQATRVALDEVKAVRAEMKDMLKTVKRREVRPEGLKAMKERADEIHADLSSRVDAPPPPKGRPARPGELEAGMEVFVTTLARKGEVVRVMTDERVEVRVGSLRTLARVKDILLPDGQRPASAPPRREEAPVVQARAEGPPQAAPDLEHPEPRTLDNTLDLRGLTRDETLEAMEAFLDRLMAQDRDVAYVLHGHGTGVLKAAVRDFVRHSRQVQAWRPGRREEGGDGITVAWLKG